MLPSGIGGRYRTWPKMNVEMTNNKISSFPWVVGDVDIILNPNYRRFWPNVFPHEIGHMFGMGHPTDPTSATAQETVISTLRLPRFGHYPLSPTLETNRDYILRQFFHLISQPFRNGSSVKIPHYSQTGFQSWTGLSTALLPKDSSRKLVAELRRLLYRSYDLQIPVQHMTGLSSWDMRYIAMMVGLRDLPARRPLTLGREFPLVHPLLSELQINNTCTGLGLDFGENRLSGGYPGPNFRIERPLQLPIHCRDLEIAGHTKEVMVIPPESGNLSLVTQPNVSMFIAIYPQHNSRITTTSQDVMLFKPPGVTCTVDASGTRCGNTTVMTSAPPHFKDWGVLATERPDLTGMSLKREDDEDESSVSLLMIMLLLVGGVELVALGIMIIICKRWASHQQRATATGESEQLETGASDQSTTDASTQGEIAMSDIVVIDVPPEPSDEDTDDPQGMIST